MNSIFPLPRVTKESYEEVRPLIGMGGDQVIPRFAPGLSDKEGTGKEIASRRKELMLEKFGPGLVAAKGARQMVERLQQEGLRSIIASSATSQELSVLLKAAKVDDLLNQDEAVASSEAEHQVMLKPRNLSQTW